MEETQKEKRSFKEKLDHFFGIKKNNTKVLTEVVAGIVTFLAMAYILTLNPSLITGDWTHGTNLWASVFIATALGAVIGTLLMAFVARMPLAQAPGLGLNSMVGAMIGSTMSLGFQCSFGNAMFIVLMSGVIFLLLSIIKIKGKTIREMIFNGVPLCVRGAISVGIGLFIAFIGLVNAGIIVPGQTVATWVSDGTSNVFLLKGSGTLVTLTSLSTYGVNFSGGAVVCLVGLIIIAILEYFHVKGSVIIGIICATLLGIPFGVTTWSGMSWEFWTYFQNFFSFQTPVVDTGATFFSVFTEGFSWAPGATVMPIIMAIVTFSMVDMFDTMGTSVACADAAGLLDRDGKPQHYDGIMLSDSIATCTGALLGTSTVTTFVESGAGVAAGGKTGLTALITAVCFLLSIFLMPLIASIPSAAASCALLYVGALMLKGIKHLKFENIKHLVPTFLTIAMMPLAYSITTGIGFGILSYVIIEVITYLVRLIMYKAKKITKPHCNVSIVTWIIFILFAVYFFVPTK